MEVASFRASQFYEIASFGIGSNCKILSLLLEGHYHHYPFLKLRCIYSVRFYTIDLKYVTVLVNYKVTGVHALQTKHEDKMTGYWPSSQ